VKTKMVKNFALQNISIIVSFLVLQKYSAYRYDGTPVEGIVDL